MDSQGIRRNEEAVSSFLLEVPGGAHVSMAVFRAIMMGAAILRVFWAIWH